MGQRIKWHRFKSFGIWALILAAPLPAQAIELGEAFKGLGKIKQVLEQGQIPKASTSSNTNLTVSNAEQYCERLKSNQLITDFSNAIAEAKKVSVHSVDIGPHLDTRDRLLTQWVELQLQPPEKQIAIPSKVYQWVNQCAYQLRGTNYSFMFTNDIRHFDQEIERYEKAAGKQNAQRAIDANGQIIQNKPLSLPTLVNGQREMATDSKWAALYAVALPNGLEVMQKLSAARPAEIIKATNERKLELEDIQLAEEKELKAKEVKQKQEQAIAQAKYEQSKTPDARLLNAYSTFQTIEKCVKVREGYELIYFTANEYQDAKTRIKKIEAKLKPSLKSTTDQLWQQASRRNAESPQYIHLELTSFELGQQICTSSHTSLRFITDELFGQELPTKSF